MFFKSIFLSIIFLVTLFANQEYSINNYGIFVLSKDKKSFYSFDPSSLYQLKLIDIDTTKVIAKYKRYKDIDLQSEDEKLLKKEMPYTLGDDDVFCVDKKNSIIYHSTSQNQIVGFDYKHKKKIFKTKTLFEVAKYSNIKALKLGKNAKTLIAGFDENLIVFDLDNKQVNYFGELRISVKALSLSPDFHYILASGLSGDMKVYDYENHKLLKQLHVEDYSFKDSFHASVDTIEFVDDDKFLFASSLKGVQLASVSSGKVIREYSEKKVSPTIAVRENIAYFITPNATIYKYNLKTKKFIEVYELPLKNVKRVKSDKKNTLILSQKDGKFIYYDLSTNRYKDYHTSFREHYTTSFAMHPTKKQFARVSSNNALQIFDVESGDEVLRMKNDIFDIAKVFSFLDDRIIIYSSNYCGFAKKAPLQFIDTKSKRYFAKKEHLDTVMSYDITKDKKYLITASTDKTIKLWSLDLKHVDRTKVLDTLYVDSEPSSVVLSDNEKYLLISTIKGDLYLWGTDLNKGRFTLLKHVIEGKKPTNKIQRKRTEDEMFNTGFNTKNTKYYNLRFYDNDTKIIVEDSQRNIIFYDLNSTKEIYRLLLFAQRDWVELFSDGSMKSSKNGYKYIDDKFYDLFVKDELVLYDTNETYVKKPLHVEEESETVDNSNFALKMFMVFVILILFMRYVDKYFDKKKGKN